MKTRFLFFLLLVAVLLFGAATTSPASLTAMGPVDPATTFPAFYQDSTGLSLAPCFDNNGFCANTMAAAPGFDPNLPIRFPAPPIPPNPPGNFPESGFYFYSQAMAGTTICIAALEFAFSSGVVRDGEQITFSRIRFIDSTAPVGTYTITHPYGVDTVDVTPADVAAGRGLRFTEDLGLAPGIFTGALTGRIGPFLRRAGGLVTSPDGRVYIGDSVSPVTVTGTPVTSVTVAGPISASTNTFILEGKVIGMSVTPTSITFPIQKPGVDSAPVPVTVANLSGVSTLTIASIVSQGTNATDFRIVDVNCLTGPIAPADLCAFNVVFNGDAAGPAARTASILISATMATVPNAVISMTGTIDTIPPVVVSTYPADGATFPFNSMITSITATFSEPILETSLTPSTFTLQGSTGARPGSVTYDAGSRTATFFPTPPLISTGTYTATITTGVTDLAGNNLAINKIWSFAVTAIPAQPAPHIIVTDSVAPVDDHQVPFGSVNVGGTSDKTVTISNSGNADLTIGNIPTERLISTGFSIMADPCSGKTISPASSCTLTIRFAPDAVGTFTDTFDIPNNDPDAFVVTVNVSGAGTPVPVPDIAVTDSVFPDSDLIIPFGNITTGTSSPVQTINITNAGTAALTISNIQLAGADASQIILNLGGGATPCTTASPAVAAGKNCTVTVVFNPLSTGAKSANVVIASNDPDEATVSIALTGTGLPATINNAPSAPALVYPANGQAGLGASITCRWKKSQDPDGDPVTYRIYYCTDRNFSNCNPDTAANLGAPRAFFAGAGLPGLLLAGAIFAFPRSARKKLLLLMISLTLIGGIVLSSCGGGGGSEDATPPARDEASHLMSGLKSATTYYWKVVADDNKGGTEESAVWSFTTQ